MRIETRSVRQGRAAIPAAMVVLRSLLLCVVVFILATLAGTLLSAAAPASNPYQPSPPVTSAPTEAPGVSAPEATGSAPDTELALGRSMVYTGTAALTVSVVGLVMVARRRRLW